MAMMASERCDMIWYDMMGHEIWWGGQKSLRAGWMNLTMSPIIYIANRWSWHLSGIFWLGSTLKTIWYIELIEIRSEHYLSNTINIPARTSGKTFGGRLGLRFSPISQDRHMRCFRFGPIALQWSVVFKIYAQNIQENALITSSLYIFLNAFVRQIDLTHI